MCCQEFVQNVLMQSVYFADHLQNTQTACGLFDFEDFFFKIQRSITFIHDNLRKKSIERNKKVKRPILCSRQLSHGVNVCNFI